MRRELWCQSGPSCGRSITSSSPWGVRGGGRGGRHVVWLLLNREDWRLRGLSGSEGQAGIKPKTPLKGLTVRSWVYELSVTWEVALSHKLYLHKRQFFCAGPPRPGLLPWAGTCRAGTCVCVCGGGTKPLAGTHCAASSGIPEGGRPLQRPQLHLPVTLSNTGFCPIFSLCSGFEN